MTYNTSRTPILLKEYGRNIQNIVAHIKSVEDKEERSQLAFGLIKFMKQINPVIDDNYQRIWDHLYLLADLELDIDSPYPIPEAEHFDKKPEQMTYRKGQPKFRHYGRNMENLVAVVSKMEDEEKRKESFATLGRLMKSFFMAWNKENVEDVTIIEHIEKMSIGTCDLRALVEEDPSLLDMNPNAIRAQARNQRKNTNSSSSGKGRNTNRNNNRGKNNNKRRKHQ